MPHSLSLEDRYPPPDQSRRAIGVTLTKRNACGAVVEKDFAQARSFRDSERKFAYIHAVGGLFATRHAIPLLLMLANQSRMLIAPNTVCVRGGIAAALTFDRGAAR